MGVLSDPSAFYAPVGADWSQGDIALAPTALLWEAGWRPTRGYPQPAPRPDGQTSVVYDLRAEDRYAKAATVEAFFGPVMVLTDDCALDKEFNARVQEMLDQGVGRDEAIDQARGDPGLDALILVAPIRPYSTLRFVAESAVRTAQAVGYFPVLGSDEVDEGYVDFGRAVPISRRLLDEPDAALSRPATNLLRWKLAQHCATRNVSLEAQIAAIVGKSVVAVRSVEDNKNRLVVELEAEEGECLRLRQEPRVSSPPASRLRGCRQVHIPHNEQHP